CRREMGARTIQGNASHEPRWCIMEFTHDGIRFQYPENWRVEQEENEDGWTVSVQSPDTAFLMLCYRDDQPDPAEVADTALEALREEYADVEADDRVDSIAGQPAIGHDIRFFSFDLTNTCWTRSFFSGRGTLLVMAQVNDLELDTNEPVLRAICASLQVDQDEEAELTTEAQRYREEKAE